MTRRKRLPLPLIPKVTARCGHEIEVCAGGQVFADWLAAGPCSDCELREIIGLPPRPAPPALTFNGQPLPLLESA